MEEAPENGDSILPLMGHDFGAGTDSAAFQELMLSIQNEPPGVAMLRIASHPGLGPAARIVFAPIMLEFIEEVDLLQGWMFVTALTSIMAGANAFHITLKKKDEWNGSWDKAFRVFARSEYWETGNETMRKQLIILLHCVVKNLDRVPEQVLVDYDLWKQRITELPDVAFRDGVTLMLQDQLRRHGYIQ